MSTRYKRHSGHHSDFDGANGQCANCGIPTYNAPELHDVHPVQMQYRTEQGDVFCEACFFDSYNRCGATIADVEKRTVYRVNEDPRRWYFDTWQAASGYARRVDAADYHGATDIYPALLTPVEE